MHSHNGTLYPMLAVGAFMAMFWTGVVAGHALGLGCLSLLMTGLLCACLGTIGVCELERRDRRVTPVETEARVSPAASPVSMPGKPPLAPDAGKQRPASAGAGVCLRSEPC